MSPEKVRWFRHFKSWNYEKLRGSPLGQYGIVVIAVPIALLLTLQLSIILKDTPTPLFFAAVMVSSWYGGMRSGLLEDVQPQIQVWAETADSWVQIWVADNGIGIAPEHQTRIFGVFERLHGIEAYPGTGIGLAIVEKGIKRMGGSVRVESQLGQGSRFGVKLSSPVQNETCLANELKSPRLKLS